MGNILDDDEKLEDPNSLKFLDILIEKSIKRMEEESFKPKIRDGLKAILLKQKVAKTAEGEKFFWELIDGISRDELSRRYSQNLTLESQIQNTILGLKHQVKNGTLPIKIITDTFNQDKSEESRLSYRRIGQLLSKMGFRKAKTHAGTCAILWDDQILSERTFSNDEDDEKMPAASPASPACPASPPDSPKDQSSQQSFGSEQSEFGWPQNKNGDPV